MVLPDQEDLIPLFEKFVDETEIIVSLLVELVIPSGPVTYPDNLEELDDESFTKAVFLSSKYTESKVHSYIDNTHVTIRMIHTKIACSFPIPLAIYQGWIHNLNDATDQVKFLNKKALDNSKSDKDQEKFKEFEKLLLAYRSSILQFNSCVLEYNRLKIGSELTPLASADISP